MCPRKQPVRSFFWCAVLCALLPAMSASAETTLEKIKRTGVITSANTFTYPPFGFIDNGNQVGLDIDLGSEIARRMGVSVTFQNIDFRGIIAALTSERVSTADNSPDCHCGSGESDSFFGAVFRRRDRRRLPRGQPDHHSRRHRRQACRNGTRSRGRVLDRCASGSRVQIKTYNTTFLALKDLENGRLDVVVSSLASHALCHAQDALDPDFQRVGQPYRGYQHQA